MRQLYADLVVQLDSGAGATEKRHCIRMFAALLGRWSDRPWLGVRDALDPTETYQELCALLFEWSTPHHDDSLTGLAYDFLDRDDSLIGAIHVLEGELGILAEHELEIRTLFSKMRTLP